MPTLRSKRPTGTDLELREQIDALERERSAFHREHVHLREDAHRGCDVTLEAAQQLFESRVASIRLSLRSMEPMPPQVVFDLAALWAATTEGFAKAFHRAIDEAEAIPGQPTFSDLTRKEFESTRDTFLKEIGDRQTELARREVERRRDEVEAELQALDGGAADQGEKVAAV